MTITILQQDLSEMERGQSGRVLTLLHPTSEVGVGFMALPQVGQFTVQWQFTVQNLYKLYVLVSSALPTTRHNMTCTVLYM